MTSVEDSILSTIEEEVKLHSLSGDARTGDGLLVTPLSESQAVPAIYFGFLLLVLRYRIHRELGISLTLSVKSLDGVFRFPLGVRDFRTPERKTENGCFPLGLMTARIEMFFCGSERWFWNA